jgi:hypothetical protein
MSKTLGQTAYEAYCGATNWKSLVSGAELPQWADTKPEIQLAWETAGAAVFTDALEKSPNVSHASVKVMRSYDYCHFEIVLGSDTAFTPQQVDELRKTAARLADKAVAQYKVAKENAFKLEYDELTRQAKEVRKIGEKDRTPEQMAILKRYQDRAYDYEDDWYEQD